MLSTHKNQDILPKVRALENSMQTIAALQEQLALFFTDKVHLLMLQNVEYFILCVMRCTVSCQNVTAIFFRNRGSGFRCEKNLAMCE